MDGQNRRRKTSLTRKCFSNIPLILSYSIVTSIWIGFIGVVSIHEVLIRRGEFWHFIEQQVMFNTLAFMTLLSLITASNRSPGSPDPTLAPETLLPPVQRPESPVDGVYDKENDIPLRSLKDNQRVQQRVEKDRPSALSIVSMRDRKNSRTRHTAGENDSGPLSAYALAASPFIPTTVDEAGEESGAEVASVEQSHLNPAEESDIVNESDRDHLLSQDRHTVRRATLMAKANTGGPRWCKKCNDWKPDRCHHCRFCEQCVLKMDHHCIWVGTCVGYHNYKPFLLFISYGTLLSLYGAAEAGYETILFFRDPETFSYTYSLCPDGHEDCSALEEIPQLDLSPVVFMIIAILGAFFAMAVGSLAVYHWWLACTNVTTLESMTTSYPSVLLAEESRLHHPRPVTQLAGHSRWKPDHLLTREQRIRLKREARDINVYDLGWKQNLRQVLGDGFLLKRIWPLSRAQHRINRDAGHFFAVNEESLGRLRQLTRELRIDDEQLEAGKDDADETDETDETTSNLSSVPSDTSMPGREEAERRDRMSINSMRSEVWFRP